MKEKIAILMSTYNGEKFINAQIDSIINQTYYNWSLYIRDDGSSDETLNIINNKITEDSRIVLIKDDVQHRGVKNSFLTLLKIIDAQYFMFCDQDDIWLPDKIEKSLRLIKSLEEYKHNTPCLVVTNLTTIDTDNAVIQRSLWHHLGMHELVKHPYFLRVAPMYTGCTMMFNKAAKICSLEGKDSIYIIHDQFIALNVFRAKGCFGIIDTPTILYRQHGGNVIGAPKNHRNKSLLNNIVDTWKSYWSYYQSTKNVLNTNIIKYTIMKIIRIVNYR